MGLRSHFNIMGRRSKRVDRYGQQGHYAIKHIALSSAAVPD